MSSDTIETPVLIAGAGPVGLALAGDLGERGIQCLVVEQGEGVPDHPRATALNSRSMEFFRRWGVAEAIKKAGTPDDFPHTALYCTTFDGYEIARIERPHHGGRAPTTTSPERPQRCNQLWLDPILRDRALRFPTVDIRYRWRFEEFVKDGDHIVATVHDLVRNERRRIAAQYLVDCSGGHSPIRRQLGIGMSGSSYIGYFLSIFVRVPELWTYHHMGKAALVNFIDERGLWRNLVNLDGRELYRFGVSGKEYYDAPDKVDAAGMFIEAVGKPIPFELISVRRWIARNVVADRYQHGRIFLAGDAAHLNHPAAGLGLNTGLGDAVDIGWKLAATLAGWGGAKLLESYETERRPVGIRNVGHADTSHANDREQRTHPDISADTPAGIEARRKLGDALVRTQTEKVITDGLALGYRYDPSPIVCSDGAAPAGADSVSHYVPSASPGGRAPHAWLEEGRSIVDLFGRDFVLLRFGSADVSAIDKAFAQRSVPLTIVPIADPKIAALYECQLVLVRPDGHVAWRGDAVPADPLALVDRLRGA